MAPSRRSRILALTSTFPRWPGDACPMFVADLCEELSRRFDVTVLAPASRGAKARERWSSFEVRRYPYGPPGLQRLADGAILPNIKRNRLLAGQVPLLVLSQLWHAWRLARGGEFDLLHAHWVLPQGVIGAMLRRQLGVPVLTTAHGADVYALRNGPASRMKRWALQTSDRVTAVSTSLQDEIVALGVERERVSVLPMGVDTVRFTPDARSDAVREVLNPSGPALLFVGRLVEKKGARYLIDAMPRILRGRPDARLTIVGDGPERLPLMARASDLSLKLNVRFLGEVTNRDLPAYFASADVFVGPSVVEANGDTESFGLVFAEAMASGCPVVATSVGGISDLVVDSETGLLVSQRDADAIAGAVLRLLDDAAERERLRANGLAWVRERFDRALLGARYGDIMEELIAA